jgi:hypothetical protein
MSARRFGYTIGLGVLAVSGLYILVYLYRWEWIRAQFAAVLFLCIEVALIGAWLAEKVAAISAEQNAQRTSGARASRAPFREVDPEILARLRSAREAESPHPFAWLTPRLDRTSVFVPVLLGAGILLSGLAWLVERLASRTAGPVVDRNLAAALGAFALPSTLLAAPPEHDWVLRPGSVPDGVPEGSAGRPAGSRSSTTVERSVPGPRRATGPQP